VDKRDALLDAVNGDSAFTAFASLRNCRIRAVPPAITMKAPRNGGNEQNDRSGRSAVKPQKFHRRLLSVLGHEDDEEDQ
jgi:hypothetical protein